MRDLRVDRSYEPDEEAMLAALRIVLNACRPTDESQGVSPPRDRALQPHTAANELPEGRSGEPEQALESPLFVAGRRLRALWHTAGVNGDPATHEDGPGRGGPKTDCRPMSSDPSVTRGGRRHDG